MRLSLGDHKIEDMHFKGKRIEAIYNQAFSNYPDNFQRFQQLYLEEIVTYKVQIEIYYSETDIWEQLRYH